MMRARLLLMLSLLGAAALLVTAAAAENAASASPSSAATNADRPMSDTAADFLRKYDISAEPVACVGDFWDEHQNPRVRRVVRLDPHRFVVDFRRRGLYLNITEGKGGCEGMRKNARYSFLRHESRQRWTLCRGDHMRIANPSGTMRTGACDVGYFYKLTKKPEFAGEDAWRGEQIDE